MCLVGGQVRTAWPRPCPGHGPRPTPGHGRQHLGRSQCQSAHGGHSTYLVGVAEHVALGAGDAELQQPLLLLQKPTRCHVPTQVHQSPEPQPGHAATAQGQPLAKAESRTPASPTTENAEQARSGCCSLNWDWGLERARDSPKVTGLLRSGPRRSHRLACQAGCILGALYRRGGWTIPQPQRSPLNLPGAPCTCT